VPEQRANPFANPTFSPPHRFPAASLGPIQVDFIEEVSTWKWSACRTATATIQDLKWDLVAQYSVQGSVFEFMLVDRQAETLVSKETVVRSLPLSSAQLTVQKVKQPVNEGMQPMKFSMPQPGPDELIRKVPVSVTVI
jgi:hypothetical protein